MKKISKKNIYNGILNMQQLKGEKWFKRMEDTRKCERDVTHQIAPLTRGMNGPRPIDPLG